MICLALGHTLCGTASHDLLANAGPLSSPAPAVYMYFVVRGAILTAGFHQPTLAKHRDSRNGSDGRHAAADLRREVQSFGFGPSPNAWDSLSSEQLYDFVRDSTAQNGIFIAVLQELSLYIRAVGRHGFPNSWTVKL